MQEIDIPILGGSISGVIMDCSDSQVAFGRKGIEVKAESIMPQCSHTWSSAFNSGNLVIEKCKGFLRKTAEMDHKNAMECLLPAKKLDRLPRPESTDCRLGMIIASKSNEGEWRIEKVNNRWNSLYRISHSTGATNTHLNSQIVGFSQASGSVIKSWTPLAQNIFLGKSISRSGKCWANLKTMGLQVAIKHDGADANFLSKSLSWYLAGGWMNVAGKVLLLYTPFRLDYMFLQQCLDYESYFSPLASIRNDWENTRQPDAGCRAHCWVNGEDVSAELREEVRSSQHAKWTVVVARVHMPLSGFPGGGGDGKYYKAMCSSFSTVHQSQSQRWLKTHFYNRENEWPQLTA